MMYSFPQVSSKQAALQSQIRKQSHQSIIVNMRAMLLDHQTSDYFYTHYRDQFEASKDVFLLLASMMNGFLYIQKQGDYYLFSMAISKIISQFHLQIISVSSQTLFIELLELILPYLQSEAICLFSSSYLRWLYNCLITLSPEQAAFADKIYNMLSYLALHSSKQQKEKVTIDQWSFKSVLDNFSSSYVPQIVLVSTLMFLSPNSIDRCLKSQLLFLLRHQFAQSGNGFIQDRHLKEDLLFYSSVLISFAGYDEELLSNLLSILQKTENCSLVLEILLFQTQQQSVIPYRLVKPLLLRVYNCLNSASDLIALFMILRNLLINDLPSRLSISLVYSDFLKGKIEHFVQKPLLPSLLDLLSVIIDEQQLIADCYLVDTVIKMFDIFESWSQRQRAKRELIKDSKIKILGSLLLKRKIKEYDLPKYLQQSQLQQFWEEFSMESKENSQETEQL